MSGLSSSSTLNSRHHNTLPVILSRQTRVCSLAVVKTRFPVTTGEETVIGRPVRHRTLMPVFQSHAVRGFSSGWTPIQFPRQPLTSGPNGRRFFVRSATALSRAAAAAALAGAPRVHIRIQNAVVLLPFSSQGCTLGRCRMRARIVFFPRRNLKRNMIGLSMSVRL